MGHFHRRPTYLKSLRTSGINYIMKNCSVLVFVHSFGPPSPRTRSVGKYGTIGFFLSCEIGQNSSVLWIIAVL
jgi:hypothetical protein